jgi:hemolysin-activating ACP:hemolysin acyltransferase
LTFAQADRLSAKIHRLFLDSGGAYTKINGEVETNILEALATGQFSIGIEHGQVQYFAAYWRIKTDDIQTVCDRVKPLDRTTGGTIYITELANQAGRKGLTEAIDKIRRQNPTAQGVFWHRPTKKDKIYLFPSQRGKGA